VNAIALARFGVTALRTSFGRLSAPYKLTFSVTNRCNLRCKTCNIWRSAGDNELSFDEIDCFFRENPSLRWVDLTGGEVTLRPDIVDIARSAATHLPHLFQFHFPTNGTMPSRAEEVVVAAVSQRIPKVVVSVSIDGPPELHDTLRGRPGTWDRAVETFQRVRSIRGAEAYFGMTITRDNLHTLFPCLEALATKVPGFTPRDLHVNIAHATFYYGSPDIETLGLRETEEVLARFRRARGSPRNPVLLLELLYQRKVPRYLLTGQSPVSCQALSSSLFLSAEGVVFPCTSFERQIGNVRDVGYRLARLWREPAVVDLSADIRRGRCPGCWTPCEAYQSIIASVFRPSTWRSG